MTTIGTDAIWVAFTEPLTIQGKHYQPGVPAQVGISLAARLIVGEFARLLKGDAVPSLRRQNEFPFRNGKCATVAQIELCNRLHNLDPITISEGTD